MFDPTKIIFKKNEIDEMDTENVRTLLYQYQLLYAKLKLQNQRLQRAELQSRHVNHKKSKFLAHAIHEVRNAMSAIVGIETILSTDRNINAEQKKRLEMLKNVTHMMRALMHKAVDIDEAETCGLDLESIGQFKPFKEEKKQSRILLVEDDPSNILVASVFLENIGYEFDIACDGKEAIKKIRSFPYSLVLMDVSMPLMDGFAATRRLRQLEKQGLISAIKIIAMTAHAMSEDRERCLHIGMDDYISKPFTQLELHKKIRQQMNIKMEFLN